jgi:GTP-binding protein
VKLFSALKKKGVDEVAMHLWDWAHPVEKPDKPDKAKRPVEPKLDDDVA